MQVTAMTSAPSPAGNPGNGGDFPDGRVYCTDPGHQPGQHDLSCMPPAEPGNPELRLLRAVFGLCPDCDREDEHEHDPGKDPGPWYPHITVQPPEDPDAALAVHSLVFRVSSAMTRAGAEPDEVRLFEDSAAEFTSYENVLRVAQYWVTILPYEHDPGKDPG